jgi:hypothetical protein
VFKAFGGGFYDDKQNNLGEVWHFVNPERGLSAKLGKAMLARFNGDVLPAQAFAQALVRQLADTIHSRGSRASKIGRSPAMGEDVARGYATNALLAITMAGKSTAGGTAKREMMRDMLRIFTGTDIAWDDFKAEYMQDHGLEELKGPDAEAAWGDYSDLVNERRLDSASQANAFEDGMAFMKEMSRNESTSERWFGVVKGLAALKYLSGVGSSVVNLTNMLALVPPALNNTGKIPWKSIPRLLTRGAKVYSAFRIYERWGKGEAPTGEDAWLMHEIASRGWDTTLMNREALGVLGGKVGRVQQKMNDIGMYAFGLSERFNRGATIAAAYYGLREQGMSQDEALAKAKLVSDDAHGVYGKVNRHALARGGHLGAQMVGSWMMFKTFSHNYLQYLVQMIGEKNLPAAAYALISPAIIGGAGASVAMPIVKGAIQALFSVIPGLEPPDDPEEEFYRWAEETFGGTAGRVARQGVAGLAGINIKGSLAIGITDIPTSLKDVLGAPWSLVEDVGYGIGLTGEGNVLKRTERLLPRMAGAPVRAYRELTEGMTTRSGKPVYYGTEQLKADWGDALLRSLSFNPADLSEVTEKQWKDRKIEAQYSDRRSEIYAAIRRWVLKGGNKAEWLNILTDIEEYNARVRSSRFTGLTYITPQAIKTQITQMRKPDRRERIRAGVTKREEPKEITLETVMPTKD